MDKNLLWQNRNRLIAWQQAHYAQVADGEVRLHLGSGKLKYAGYVNVDMHTAEADVHADLSHLTMYADVSVDEICCHHALEHTPQPTVEDTLREWYRVLKSGGKLDLGLPDLELCMRDFLEASEDDKWTKYIKPIYGLDEPGMHHQSGLSLGRLRVLLERIGFRVLESFNYDANGCASSMWVWAEKPAQIEHAAWVPTALESDVVMGVFTHRTTYLPVLMESVKRHVPHIPFITHIEDGPINRNMEALRQKFIASGKRYWIFLDDDIQFLNPSIVHDAIFDLVKNHWAGVGVYSTFDPEIMSKPYATTGLVTRKTTWLTGYFICVDSHLVGDVVPDLNLPDGNTSVDTSYSAEIVSRGYTVGLSANLVYHQKKEVWAKMDIVEVTNKYLLKKWGNFYFDEIRYDGNVIEWPLSR